MRAGIALGSNIGDRARNIGAAREAIAQLKGVSDPIRHSRLYITEPVGCEPGTPAFLNAVTEVEFDGEPRDLLRALLAIEERLGRPLVRPKNEPRTIDLDLLYAGEVLINEPDCTLPHPAIGLRGFVLVPLSELAPEKILPGYTSTVAALLQKLDASDVRVFE